MPSLPWIVLALALLPCGWMASAWWHGRKIRSLRAQLEAVRRTAAEHAQQVRHQIAVLQSELAARPPMPTEERERRASAAEVAAAATSAAPGAEDPAPAHGFAPTAVLPHGFAPTEVMPERSRGRTTLPG